MGWAALCIFHMHPLQRVGPFVLCDQKVVGNANHPGCLLPHMSFILFALIWTRLYSARGDNCSALAIICVQPQKFFNVYNVLGRIGSCIHATLLPGVCFVKQQILLYLLLSLNLILSWSDDEWYWPPEARRSTSVPLLIVFLWCSTWLRISSLGMVLLLGVCSGSYKLFCFCSLAPLGRPGGGPNGTGCTGKSMWRRCEVGRWVMGNTFAGSPSRRAVCTQDYTSVCSRKRKFSQFSQSLLDLWVHVDSVYLVGECEAEEVGGEALNKMNREPFPWVFRRDTVPSSTFLSVPSAKDQPRALGWGAIGLSAQFSFGNHGASNLLPGFVL